MSVQPALAEMAAPAAARADYDTVRRALEFVAENFREQPEAERIAAAAGTTPRALTELFRRWCGLTPKEFLAAVTLDHARQVLREAPSVLEASLELGLSGPGRLHDLFVAHEAMSPGEWKRGGAGLAIAWGFHPSPFGTALVMATERGLCGLAFADAGEEAAALDDLRARWPNARYVEEPARTATLARRIFDPAQWRPETPLRVVLIGTDFEVRVWETLLRIPIGRATSYSAIASEVGRPKGARARWAPPSARTRSRSSCPATACSARTARSPATTGGSRASARCWGGRRGNFRRRDQVSLPRSNPR